jgi:hypothetical protein
MQITVDILGNGCSSLAITEAASAIIVMKYTIETIAEIKQ